MSSIPVSPVSTPPRLDAQLCFKLYAINNLLGRLYRPLLDPLGLTYPQYLTMLALWEAGECSVGELGRRLRLDSGTLTPLLKRLEATGFVARRRDREDERRVIVSLTAAGAALGDRAAAVPRDLACRVSDVALRDAKEFQILSARLQTLVDALARALDEPERNVSPAA